MTARTAFAGKGKGRAFRPSLGFAAPSRREFALSAAEGRRAWLELLLAAKLQADRARRGEAAEADDLVALRRLAMGLRSPFPVRQMTADLAASAVLSAVIALTETSIPRDREDLAAFILPGLAFLERVVAEDAHARAELSRRIAGEPTDDGDV